MLQGLSILLNTRIQENCILDQQIHDVFLGSYSISEIIAFTDDNDDNDDNGCEVMIYLPLNLNM